MKQTSTRTTRAKAKSAEACGELGLAHKLFKDLRKLLLTKAKV